MPPKTPIDRRVGERLRKARKLAGMSSVELAERLGISPQQIGKFELGQNRIFASQLWMLSEALGRPIDWFFDLVPSRRKLDAGMGRQIEFFDTLATLDLTQVKILATMANALVPDAKGEKRRAEREDLAA